MKISDHFTFVVGDGDLVFFARALVNSRHIQDTVSVDVKGHLYLGDATGSWGNASQFELAEKVVVFRHGTLTFVHLENKDCPLKKI